MAITVDGTPSNTYTAGASSPLTIVPSSIGVNSKRTLIVSVGGESFTITGVTAKRGGGAVAMTAINTTVSGGGFLQSLWGMTNPDSGTQSIVVTFTGSSANVEVGWLSLFNCDQTSDAGWHNSGTATGTGSPATKTLTYSANEMAVAAALDANGASSAISVGTSAWIDTAHNGNFYMGYNASAGTVSWTFTGAVAWAWTGTCVMPFSSGGLINDSTSDVDISSIYEDLEESTPY